MGKERTQECLRLIREGELTAKEIANVLRYSRPECVRTIARLNGLDVVKQSDKHKKEIQSLRDAGLTYEQIAHTLSMDKKYVARLCCLMGINQYADTEKRHCLYCGKEFEAPKTSNKLYCCDEHQDKVSRIRCKSNPNADDSYVAEMVRTHAPGWEYVGGYTGSDGTVEIRHKVCGTTTIKSVTTIRHGRKLICAHCEDLKREAKEKAKAEARAKAKAERHAKAIENKRKRYDELRLPKAKPIVKCKVCGQWFYGKSKRSCVCSDECQRKIDNHRWSLKKETRRRKAQTEETKTITLQKLYERDSGICWICGKPCDINVHYNSNNYPSVDHLIPISKGGKDEWSNIRLAHRGCNSRRGNDLKSFIDIPRLANFFTASSNRPSSGVFPLISREKHKDAGT